jgi:hypothetical protein
MCLNTKEAENMGALKPGKQAATAAGVRLDQVLTADLGDFCLW